MKKIIIFLCAILMVSCTPKKQNDTLILGVMPSMDYLPLSVAAREGYFDRLGVTVSIQRFNSPNERDAAFQSANVDGVVIDYTGAVLRHAGGISLKLVSKCDAPFYLIAGKNTGIKDMNGLKGKKVGTAPNSVIDFCIDMALKNAGMEPTDIEKIDINMIPVRFEMLANDRIDAAGLPDPLALKSIMSENVLLSTNSELGFAVTGIMFSEKALSDKRDQITKMYEAYNMGVDYLNSHSLEDVQDILISDMGFTEDIVLSAKLPSYTKAMPPAEEDIAVVVEWLSAKNLVDSAFDIDSLIDTSVLGK